MLPILMCIIEPDTWVSVSTRSLNPGFSDWWRDRDSCLGLKSLQLSVVWVPRGWVPPYIWSRDHSLGAWDRVCSKYYSDMCNEMTVCTILMPVCSSCSSCGLLMLHHDVIAMHCSDADDRVHILCRDWWLTILLPLQSRQRICNENIGRLLAVQVTVNITGWCTETVSYSSKHHRVEHIARIWSYCSSVITSLSYCQSNGYAVNIAKHIPGVCSSWFQFHPYFWYTVRRTVSFVRSKTDK